MAKKKNEEQPLVVEKNLTELSDREFLDNVERRGEQIYFQYLTARENEILPFAGYVTDEKIEKLVKNVKTPVAVPQNKNTGIQTNSKKGGYIKKRTAALVLILILSLLMIAVVVVGAINIANVSKFLDLYEGPTGDISIVDPIIAGICSLAKIETNSNFAVYYVSEFTEGIKYDLIAPYAIFATTIFYLLSLVVIFIKSLVALGGKRDACGFYKKRKFGFWAIASFLCALVCVFAGIYISGGNIGDFVTFFTRGETAFIAGFGLYIMIGVPILIFILTCCAYKKQRKAK